MLTLGLQMQAVVVGWQIYKLTQDPFSLGLIGLAEAVPALSIALYAGHIADIYNKKKILIFALLGLLFCSLGLLFSVSQNFLQTTQTVWLMYMFILISGFARGFYSPAAFSVIPQLINRNQLTQASTLNSTSWQFAAVIGPALGGLFYAWFGIVYTFIFICLAIITALFCISNIVLLFEPTAKQIESIGIRLKEGINFVFKNKIVLSAISLDLFSVLFGGAGCFAANFCKRYIKSWHPRIRISKSSPICRRSNYNVVFIGRTTN
jgi:MFS family permease